MAKKNGWRLTRLARSILLALVVIAVWVIASNRDESNSPAPDKQTRKAKTRTPPKKPAKADTLVVGSWNLEWFGTPSKRKGRARSEEALDQIVTVIGKTMRPGVMTLNEINVASTNWRALKRKLAARGYQSIEPAMTSASQQETVMLYDTEQVKPIGLGAYVPMAPVRHSKCPPTTPRSPIVATFKAGSFDFTAVGAHLIAQGDRGCGGSTRRAAVRKAEAQRLLAYLTSSQNAGMIDRDIIILGDLNTPPGDASVSPLTRGGLIYLTTPDHRSSGSGAYSYRKGPYKHALDHVLISKPAEREYLQKSAEYPAKFSTFNAHEFQVFRENFSDHAPVWARFRTDLGDDD